MRKLESPSNKTSVLNLFPALVFLFFVPAAMAHSATEPSAGPAPSSERIQRLIQALGNADYFVRQNAEAELGHIGFEAIDALTAAAEDDDMEIATRAGRLLYTIRGNWSVRGDPAEVSQLLAGYDSQDENSREVRIMRLIDLPKNQGLPAICRIIRYERLAALAKVAALRLLAAMAGPGLPSILELREAGDFPRPGREAANSESAATVQKLLARVPALRHGG